MEIFFYLYCIGFSVCIPMNILWIKAEDRFYWSVEELVDSLKKDSYFIAFQSVQRIYSLFYRPSFILHEQQCLKTAFCLKLFKLIKLQIVFLLLLISLSYVNHQFGWSKYNGCKVRCFYF